MSRRKRNPENASRAVQDAAKSLLANIRFMSIDEPIRTIAITSSIPNEGKSFVAASLAQAIASSNRSVLLVEGDLRKRSLAAQLKLHPEHGLYSVLSGRVDLMDAVAPTPQSGMFFLDAEPKLPNPSDIVGSKRFADLLKLMAQRFRYVIVDTPPVGIFVDAAVIAAQTDTTLYVVRENFVKRNVMQGAFDQLRKAEATIGGVVMNFCGDGSSDYYGYGSDYYEYYSGGGKKSKRRNDDFERVGEYRPLPPMEDVRPQAKAPARHSAGSHARN